jgi:hypothetical protein
VYGELLDSWLGFDCRDSEWVIVLCHVLKAGYERSSSRVMLSVSCTRHGGLVSGRSKVAIVAIPDAVLRLRIRMACVWQRLAMPGENMALIIRRSLDQSWRTL